MDAIVKNKKKHIPNLDGLRAVSILLVLVHHLPALSGYFLGNLQVHGKSGVTLFFVISGFLICSLAIKELEETKSFSLWNFYVRRTLRLFPLYYAVLAFVSFLVFVIDVYPPETRLLFKEKLLSYIFYYSNLFEISGPFSLLWSLAVEEQFYFLFSLVFFFSNKKITSLFFLTLLLIKLQPFVSYPTTSTFTTLDLLHRAFDFFEPIFMGVLLAFAFNVPRAVQLFNKYLNNFYVLTLLTLGLIVFLLSDLKEGHIYEASLTLLVGICALSKPLPIIGGRLMSHIGKVSYGIYLLHTIVFFALKKYLTADPLWLFCIGTPLAILAATLSYNYFEKPFMTLKKKFYSVPPIENQYS